VKRSRIEREFKTISVMVALYCRHQHRGSGICAGCRELLEYSRERLTRCPFQEGKTVCSKCQVHCFRPDMRAKVKTVMRYSGPRMMYRHPVLALYHVIDGRRQAPHKPVKVARPS